MLRRALVLAIAASLVVSVPALAAKGGKPHAATVTDSVSIVESAPFSFGQAIHVVFTSADPNAEGLVQVQASAGGGLAQYVAASGDAVTLGPTPSWGAGGGTLYLTLVDITDGTVTTLIDPVTFDVVP